MADPTDEHEVPPLSERFLDLFVFLPTGVAVTLAEELPRLAERGRERLGMQVNSARAIGKFAVTAGGHELKRRSEGMRKQAPRSGSTPPAPSRTPPATPPAGPPRLRSIPRPPVDGTTAGAAAASSPAAPPTPAPAPAAGTVAASAPSPASVPAGRTPAADAPAAAPGPGPTTPRPASSHVPEVGSLAIPGFDTLSASQVVQRLDGLSRSELVAVRAYETSTRGRRTILSRVDQLLDERS
jgi:hypothetical protein